MTRTFKEIQALKKPNETAVDILVDVDLNRTLSELARRYEKESRDDKKLNRPPKAPGILKELESLQGKLEESKVTFRFRDPGRRKFDALVDACPPTKEEKELHQFDWHPDTFVPALLALTAIEPELTEKEAQEIYNEWGRGDVEALFNTALQACLEQASIPFTRRGTDEILDSVRNLTTPPKEESPTLNS